MSTYVVSMIEIRQGGEWELLKEFKRSEYLACERDGVFPKDLTWEMHKTYLEDGEKEQVIGYIENSCHFNEDYYLQDFLLNQDNNGGFFENDLGMPEDASKETIKRYNEYGHNASIPSYFYLVDIVAAYRTKLEEFMNIKMKSSNNHEVNMLSDKINMLLEHNNISYPKEEKLDEVSDYGYKMMFGEIINVYAEICRIRTLVESQYGNLKPTDVRIIWFIY